MVSRTTEKNEASVLGETDVNKSCWRERLWREEEIGSLERADGRERVRWKKKEKCDHWQCLGARAAFILGAQRTESGSHCLNRGQEGIRARLQVGKGPTVTEWETQGF